MVDEIIRVYGGVLKAKDLEQIFRVITAVANPFATEDLTPRHKVAVHPPTAGPWRNCGLNLVSELRRDTLIRIEPEHPVRGDGQMTERPVPLTRVGFKRMRHDPRVTRACNRQRSVHAAGVDDEDVLSPGGNAVKAGREITLLVERQNHHRDRQTHHAATPVASSHAFSATSVHGRDQVISGSPDTKPRRIRRTTSPFTTLRPSSASDPRWSSQKDRSGPRIHDSKGSTKPCFGRFTHSAGIMPSRLSTRSGLGPAATPFSASDKHIRYSTRWWSSSGNRTSRACRMLI